MRKRNISFLSFKRLGWLSVLGLLALGVWLKFRKSDLVPNTKSQKVEQKDLSQLLQLSGRVVPEKNMVITAQQSGRILRLEVKEGDKVEIGSPLFQMRLQADGQNELGDLRTRVKSLDLEYAALQKLWKGKESLSDLIGSAQIQREASDLEKLKLERDAARNRLRVLESDLGDQSLQAKSPQNAGVVLVRSPLAGIVTLVDKRPGDFVIGGGGMVMADANGNSERMVMVVAEMNHLQVRTRVMEADLRNVKKGQAVKVRLDAYPDLQFEGFVEQIGGQGRTEVKAGYTYFDVFVGIKDQDPRILPEMNASVDLQLAEKKGALSLPSSAVLLLPNQAFVRQPKGKEWQYQAVKAGVIGQQGVEILEGLKLGDVVYDIDFADPKIMELAGHEQTEQAAKL